MNRSQVISQIREALTSGLHRALGLFFTEVRQGGIARPR